MSAIALRMPGARVTPWATTIEQPLPLDDPSALAARIGVGDGFRAAIMVGEPFSAKMNNILPALSTCCGSGRPVALFGGMASGASQPGHNILLLDDDEVRAGAIGVSLSGEIDVDVVVSQGSRPIGEPVAVTALEANVITELGGQPPMQILKDAAETLDEPDRELLNRGLLIGVAIDESKPHLGRGDFLVRNVIALNPKDGSVAVGEVPRLGQLIQFHIRDAVTADEDLRLLLDAQMMSERPFAGLLFTCNGRGSRLFAEPNHDVNVVQERLGPLPLAGFFAAGEIGPIGDRSFLHGHTAVLGLLRKRRG
jgi:small ligand-binding sensory domain FIST